MILKSFQYFKYIGNAKKITTYIYRFTWILNLCRKHSNGNALAKQAVTCFANSYLTLNCIKQQKNTLGSVVDLTSTSYSGKLEYISEGNTHFTSRFVLMS